MKILIIGPDSYLSQGIAKHFKNCKIDSLSRADPERNSTLFKKYDAIINFTIQPDFFQKELSETELIDVQIAKKLIGSKTKLVMLSSRKVYGSHENADIISENDKLNPGDFYGKNKVTAENYLQKILPNQHLILRIANILGEPVNRKGYKTFIGWISDSILTNGKLIVTENPQTKKDFITREYLQRALYNLIIQNKNGIFNVGSGFALPLDKLLSGIVGKENISFVGNIKPRDQFILNIKKLQTVIPPFTRKELKDKCVVNQSILRTFKESKQK